MYYERSNFTLRKLLKTICQFKELENKHVKHYNNIPKHKCRKERTTDDSALAHLQKLMNEQRIIKCVFYFL